MLRYDTHWHTKHWCHVRRYGAYCFDARHPCVLSAAGTVCSKY